MAVFRYTGFSQGGQSVAGSIDATSEQTALDLLVNRGITATSLDSGPARQAAEKTAGLARRRIPATTRTLFVRELATFLEADIPLLEALGVMRDQESNSAFQNVLADLYGRVQGGESFSAALGAHPAVFPPLLTSMVRVGETGGMLAGVLEQMASWMEHEQEVRGEITNAMAYPLVVLTLGALTVMILVSFVLPRISSIFVGMEANLPLPTKILMSVAGFMGKWWWLFLVAITVAVAALRWAVRTAGGRAAWDHLMLTTPIFGSLNLKAAVARMARACAALLGAGVPLLETLQVVRGLMTNSKMAQVIDRAKDRVTQGQSLAKALGDTPFFPGGVIHLLSVGERTGRLGEMFGRVAGTLERQTRARIKVLLELLAPALIVVLAVLVAAVALSILLPIFRMNQILR